MSRAIQSQPFSNEIVTQDGEVIEAQPPLSAIESTTRAEVDIQISTAKRYPRSVAKAIAQAKTMVSIDRELAAACTYWLPKRKGSDEHITGPSIRLAEIMSSCWGNLRVVGRVIEDDGKFLTAQGMAHDLENNVAFSVETKRGVTTKYGQRYSDDMIKTTGNAAISIAVRNAIFRVIPRAFVALVEDAALEVAKGTLKDLPTRLDGALAWFRGKGIEESRVLAAIEATGREDVTLDMLCRLNGLRTAVKEGHAKIEEIFPVAIAESPKTGKTDTISDKLAKNLGPKPADKPEPPEPGSEG